MPGGLYDNWTREQKLRSAVSGIIWGALILIIGVMLIVWMQRHFPNMDEHLRTLIEVSLSLPVSGLLMLGLYKTVVVRMFPDPK